MSLVRNQSGFMVSEIGRLIDIMPARLSRMPHAEWQKTLRRLSTEAAGSDRHPPEIRSGKKPRCAGVNPPRWHPALAVRKARE